MARGGAAESPSVLLPNVLYQILFRLDSLTPSL